VKEIKFNVGVIQMKVEFGSPDKNIEKVKKLVKKATKKDINAVILPEMWNTGFFPENVDELADKEGQVTKELFSDLSRKYDVNIIGGTVANVVDNRVMNTSYVFNRSGELVADYSKTHLFTHSGEDDYFDAGDHLTVFNLDGVKCSLAVCYEVRFPELFRTLALKDALINFVPAQWPLKRNDHWRTLLKTRAIENQNFVVGVNASGVTDDGLELGGHSACIDPWGKRLHEAGKEQEIFYSELDLSVVEDIRSSINVFEDRRTELYEI